MSDQRQGSSEFRCAQCDQSFNSSEALRRHNEMQHKEQKNPAAGLQKQSHAGSGR